MAAVKLQQIGNTIYFSAVNATSGREIWRFDGNRRALEKISEFGEGAADMNVVNTEVFGEYLLVAERLPLNRGRIWAIHNESNEWRVVKEFDGPVRLFPSTSQTVWVGVGKSDGPGAALVGILVR